MDPQKVIKLLELIEKANNMPPEAGMTPAELEDIRVKAKADIVTELAKV